MVQPTVGRMVYYRSYGTPGGEYPSTDRAAVITAVSPDGVTVDLCVFNPEGLFFNRQVSQGPQGGQWDWMPFQKDQAARLAAGTRNESQPEPREGSA
jgi:hypothetical protein